MTVSNILQNGAAEMGLFLSADALSRFEGCFRALEEKNKVMNLTAISGEEDVAQLHFLDSLGVLKAADIAGKRVIDVGTGAGFPGLALKIAVPDASVTLLDSLGKRVEYLKETCCTLGIEADCVTARAEEAALLPEYRESFDFAVSRAVASLSMLAELCLPYVRVGGAMLAMKGTDCAEELKATEGAAAKLGGRIETPVDYKIPGTDVTHRIIIISKVTETPKKYPRRFAKIKKEAL